MRTSKSNCMGDQLVIEGVAVYFSYRKHDAVLALYALHSQSSSWTTKCFTKTSCLLLKASAFPKKELTVRRPAKADLDTKIIFPLLTTTSSQSRQTPISAPCKNHSRRPSTWQRLSSKNTRLPIFSKKNRTNEWPISKREETPGQQVQVYGRISNVNESGGYHRSTDLVARKKEQNSKGSEKDSNKKHYLDKRKRRSREEPPKRRKCKRNGNKTARRK